MPGCLVGLSSSGKQSIRERISLHFSHIVNWVPFKAYLIPSHPVVL